jgi:hypothetical protein
LSFASSSLQLLDAVGEVALLEDGASSVVLGEAPQNQRDENDDSHQCECMVRNKAPRHRHDNNDWKHDHRQPDKPHDRIDPRTPRFHNSQSRRRRRKVKVAAICEGGGLHPRPSIGLGCRGVATAAPLPQPMLARSKPIPTRGEWCLEVKWDGFRSLLSTENRLRLRSRRGLDMTELVPELASFPACGIFDGELVAFDSTGAPDFPLVCERLLNRRPNIRLTYIVFDVLSLEGESLMPASYSERRAQLEALDLNGLHWRTPQAFDDGDALFEARLRARARGDRRETSFRPVSAGRARLDQDQESGVLALGTRARVSDEQPASPPIRLTPLLRRGATLPDPSARVCRETRN